MNVPPIVAHFARFIGGDNALARRAAALACLATQTGHVCADLDCRAGWGPWADEMDDGERAGFLAALPQLACVGKGLHEDDWTPLVWDGRRLYLRRYRDYERRVADDLLARVACAETHDAQMESRLEHCFADAGQRGAARVALSRRLALISGGPGTGKTHTLARIIALLLEREPALHIALAAPTGKAAARMTEALRMAGVAAGSEGQTLHRLLGMRAGGGGFRFNRARPLAVDVLVVDEASMIDLSLMAHLLDALPPTARLILLGDRDQLAAVEAGAVFADLCASPRLADCVATLTTSFRFGGESGIGRLAERLRRGDPEGALAQLRAAGDDLVWQPGASQQELAEAARAGYRDYLDGVAAGLAPEALFALFSHFRVLCAHRQDAAALNRALAGERLRPAPGTPVMVLRNDPLLRLFNGDIGLVLADRAEGSLTACFAGEGTGVRRISLARLPAWEPAWAMTVHKSQGSEFERVMLVLPAAASPVATRELVYTGITRAKRGVALWAGETILRAAIERRAERMSGLGAALE